jgi:Glycosyl hydrolase catalytic core
MKRILQCLILFAFSNQLNAQLIIHQNYDQTGTNATCLASTIYKGATIPNGLNDGIKSITLSQGFQAVLAANEDGSGESFCYVAKTSNVTVNLAFVLQDKISFIRVLPITGVLKKGACTQVDLNPALLNIPWFYDWGVNDNSAPGREYTLMAWDENWVDTEAKIDGYIAKPGITSMLTFNEPDGIGQGNVTWYNGASLYKKLLRTGYRMGSPSTTEGEYNDWLLMFMNRAKRDTLRVDYVGIHWYDWGNWLSTNNANPDVNGVFTRFKNYVTNAYNLHKKPIWITEFNCNVNRPTAVHQAFMALALPWLETNPQVERYSYFFEDQSPEAVGGVLTTLGQSYKDHVSTPAIATNIVDSRSPFSEIVSWNTSAITGGGQSISNFMPTYIATDLTAVTGLTRGSGTTLSPSSITNGYWGANSFSTTTAAAGITADKVLTFQLQSTNGKNVSYNSIDSFKIRIAADGPIAYQVDYKINAGAFMLAGILTGPTATVGNYTLNSLNLSGIAALQNVPPTTVVTFRITPYNASGTGVFYFGAGTSDVKSDFSITGRLSN